MQLIKEEAELEIYISGIAVQMEELQNKILHFEKFYLEVEKESQHLEQLKKYVITRTTIRWLHVYVAELQYNKPNQGLIRCLRITPNLIQISALQCYHVYIQSLLKTKLIEQLGLSVLSSQLFQTTKNDVTWLIIFS